MRCFILSSPALKKATLSGDVYIFINKRKDRIKLLFWDQGGCGGESGGSEGHGEALQAIIHLYEKQDFAALVRDRYAEIGKAENEQQIQTLIGRFERRCADEGKRNQATDLYAFQFTENIGRWGCCGLQDGQRLCKAAENAEWQAGIPYVTLMHPTSAGCPV